MLPASAASPTPTYVRLSSLTLQQNKYVRLESLTYTGYSSGIRLFTQTACFALPW